MVNNTTIHIFVDIEIERGVLHNHMSGFILIYNCDSTEPSRKQSGKFYTYNCHSPGPSRKQSGKFYTYNCHSPGPSRKQSVSVGFREFCIELDPAYEVPGKT
jgi:hypothetical protein